jgi:hypothetical protein
MAVLVRIHNATVYYHLSNASGTASKHHPFLPIPGLPGQTTVPDDMTPVPITTFTLSRKHGVTGVACEWLSLSDNDFSRFKNGGKRLPSRGDEKLLVHDGGVATSRKRKNRDDEEVQEGDVGPYGAGPGNLKRRKLVKATSVKPAHWQPGAANTPAFYETDPSHPHDLNRDHQNNFKSLSLRANPISQNDGVAIAIPQYIHTNGYTFGNKAKDTTLKKTGESRSQWIADNPSAGMFKEMHQTIRFYAESDQLTYEIVGSYRYLYKLSVKRGQIAGTDELDNLIMHYLKLAK